MSARSSWLLFYPRTSLSIALVFLMGFGVPHATHAEGPGTTRANPPVLVIVEVPKPWLVPRFLVARKMRDTISEYEALPGLAFKAYSIRHADGAFGGLYLWDDADRARTWFSPGWFERVERERGAAAQVRFFQVLTVIDTVQGGTLMDTRSKSVASLLMLPPNSVLADFSPEALVGLVAADKRVPGLLRRYRVIDEGGRTGVLSIWESTAAARLLMSDSMEAESEWFDTPILLPSSLPSHPSRLGGSEGAPQ